MLNREEKAQVRERFKLKIYESDGQAFETLFTKIMRYAEPDFQQIKPWGNIGDRKNDGYIKSKGIYFQVYAPENIQNNYPEIIKKLETDFAGLLKQWNQSMPIKEFYFVVNDKYNGVNADAEQVMKNIVDNNNLSNGEIKTASYLEDLLFKLADDQIEIIIGHIYNPTDISILNYSDLNVIISHIMQSSIPIESIKDWHVPDWNTKIQFNNLSEGTKSLLDQGSIQIENLENYLNNNSNSLSTELCKKIREIYSEEKQNSSGDELFWKIVLRISPKDENSYVSAVVAIIAKYFETCDIFEKPTEDK